MKNSTVVDYYLMPQKAFRKQNDINNIIANADDRMYLVKNIVYNSGMIRFESLQHDSLFINFYATSFTVTIEKRDFGGINRQYHHRKLTTKEVIKIFNNPNKFLN